MTDIKPRNGSASKNKGKRWELDICKYLSSILGGSFIRTSNSGAFVGGNNNFRKQLLSDNQIRGVKSDIIPPDNMSKLNIEAKNYADIPFHQFINGDCAQLNTWIEQTEQSADNNDISFTIFKITRKGSWVAFRKDMCDDFLLDSYVYYVRKVSSEYKIPYIITDYESFFINNSEKIKYLGEHGINILK